LFRLFGELAVERAWILLIPERFQLIGDKMDYMDLIDQKWSESKSSIFINNVQDWKLTIKSAEKTKKKLLNTRIGKNYW